MSGKNPTTSHQRLHPTLSNPTPTPPPPPPPPPPRRIRCAAAGACGVRRRAGMGGHCNHPTVRLRRRVDMDIPQQRRDERLCSANRRHWCHILGGGGRRQLGILGDHDGDKYDGGDDGGHGRLVDFQRHGHDQRIDIGWRYVCGSGCDWWDNTGKRRIHDDYRDRRDYGYAVYQRNQHERDGVAEHDCRCTGCAAMVAEDAFLRQGLGNRHIREPGRRYDRGVAAGSGRDEPKRQSDLEQQHQWSRLQRVDDVDERGECRDRDGVACRSVKCYAGRL